MKKNVKILIFVFLSIIVLLLGLWVMNNGPINKKHVEYEYRPNLPEDVITYVDSETGEACEKSDSAKAIFSRELTGDMVYSCKEAIDFHTLEYGTTYCYRDENGRPVFEIYMPKMNEIMLQSMMEHINSQTHDNSIFAVDKAMLHLINGKSVAHNNSGWQILNYKTGCIENENGNVLADEYEVDSNVEFLYKYIRNDGINFKFSLDNTPILTDTYAYHYAVACDDISQNTCADLAKTYGFVMNDCNIYYQISFDGHFEEVEVGFITVEIVGTDENGDENRLYLSYKLTFVGELQTNNLEVN